MNVLLRADGGSEIGYGHLIRSKALAEVLLQNNDSVTLATTTPNTAQDIFPTSVRFVELPVRDKPDPLVGQLQTKEYDVVFVDAYPVDTKYQQAICQHAKLAIHVDDTRHAICADILINGNLYAQQLDYEFVGSNPKQYLGPKYTLLRSEVQEMADQDPVLRSPPERALIAMGGSDIANLTPTVLRAFDGLSITVDTIVGPGVSHRQENSVHQIADEITADVRVVRDPDDLVHRMHNADFAVSTASSITYELLAVGTPIISIPVVENQVPIADALRDQKLALVLDRRPSEESLREAIQTYMEKKQLRKERQLKGRELVDGEGTRRSAKAIHDTEQ